MKYSLLLFLIIASVTAFAQNEDVLVLLKDATRQNWTAPKGNRTGIKFAIKVVVNTKLNTSFKNVWIGEENVPFDATLFSPNEENKINPGDSLLLTYNMVKDVFNDNSEAPKLPFKYIGAALVEVYIDGIPRYFTINEFRELE